MRRRKVLAKSVRSVIEFLESRTLLSGSVLVVGTGTASITGTVYNDTNADGKLNNSEGGIPGTTVFLDINNNTQLDANEPSLTTDATGAFSFSSVAPGEYNLVVVPQTGLVQAPSPYTVSLHKGAAAAVQIGEVALGTAGNIGDGTINGVVFNDDEQSGLYDPTTDNFLAGDVVFLDTNGNGLLDPGEPSTVTNNVGFYSFTEAPGSYEAVVVPRTGFHQDPPGYAQIQVTSGDQTLVNIGENNRTSISGAVFQDLNGNGIQDAGETSVAGEFVFLDENLDGQPEPGTYNPSTGHWDGGEPYAATDANGNYSLIGLDPGEYRLIISSEQGMVQDNPGYVDVIVNQSQDLVQNLGEGLPASISGTVFNDRNANGVQDAGEIGLVNQGVFADVNNNGVFDFNGVDSNGRPEFVEPSSITAADGTYSLTNLGPGTYTVRVIVPTGGQATGPLNATHSFVVTVGSGQDITGTDFGLKTPNLTISILKYPTAPTLTNVRKQAVVRITNVGSLPANGLIGFTLYASTTTPLNTGASTIITTMPGRKMHLAPGQSRTFTISFKYPTQLPLDSYYITAQVNSSVGDNDAANDISASLGPVQVGPPYIDLGLTYAAQPPLFVMPATSSVLSLLVTNTGNFTTTGTVTFQLYTSSTNQLEPDETPTASVTVNGRGIRPGHSKIFNITLPYPGATLGNRYVIVAVVTGDPLGEFNTGNNVALPAQLTFFQ